MTLIKKYFKSEAELQNFLNSRFPTGHQAENLKTIIHIGFLNDLLAEPRGNKNSQNVDSYISWLETKYLNAFQNRTDTRSGNSMQTIPDSIVDVILSAKFNYSNDQVKLISKQHRLSMQAENLVGSFLEEYLDEKLRPAGWVCCYGETLKHSDFCHPRNHILQVKNRNNTENSSSSKIRQHNPRIKMWFRTFNQNGKSNWENIYSFLKVSDNDNGTSINGINVILNEDDFREFVKNTIRKNPKILKDD